MNKPIHPKTLFALLAIAAAFLVGSLAVGGNATANVGDNARIEHAALALQAQQTQRGSEPGAPLDTTFTYQGRLKDGPNPANGQYDFEFKLFDSTTGGTQVGATLVRSNLTVSEGLVTASLTFGLSFQGQERYLEVAVRPTGGGSFTTLSPRQEVSPAPYAMGLRPGTVITSSTAVVQFTFDGAGYALSASSTADAIRAEVNGNCANCDALQGINNAIGVSGTGVRGESLNGIGVYGEGGTWAGFFEGNVRVNGQLSKASGSFQIDHPLDPANKYLYHSFVESPDMMNIYNGNTTTDANGEAVIALPDYFEALNKDFRYQLTPIGQFAQAIIAEEISANLFTIKTDKPNVKVSWQVTGIRRDAYAEKHRIQVEEDKGEERGKYLHPTEHGQPDSMGIGYEESQRLQSEP